MLGRPWGRWWRLAAGAALVVAGGLAGPALAHEGGLTTVTVPPGVTLPPVALADLATPDVATPPLSTPVATVPPVTLPPVTVPSVTVPPVQVGGAATPAAAGPATGSTGAGAQPSTGPEPAVAGVGTPAGTGPAPSTAPSTPGAGAGTGAEVVAAVTERAPLAVRLRRAAAETVGHLSFPIGLAAAIAGFLLVQHRLDRDDPRVAPPALGDDDLLEFS